MDINWIDLAKQLGTSYLNQGQQDRLDPYGYYRQQEISPIDMLKAFGNKAMDNYSYAQEQFDPRYGRGDGPIEYGSNLINGRPSGMGIAPNKTKLGPLQYWIDTFNGRRY